MKLKEGIHIISNEIYHADPVIEPSLSRSMISAILNCPAKAFIKHPRLNPNFKADDGDGKFDIGSATHSLLLEGIDNAEVIQADSWRTQAVKEQRELARQQGKVPLLEKEWDKTIVMVQAAEKQISECPELEITNLREDGDSELSLIWTETDEISRTSWHRVRPDWWSKDRKLMIDYKTTGTSADPNEYLSHITRMEYELQEAYYRRGAKALSGIDPKFIFMVQETEEPYLCSFIGLQPMFQEIGKQKTEFGIFLWNQCMQTGKWEGYPNKVCWVEPPAWAMTQWENKSMEIGV